LDLIFQWIAMIKKTALEQPDLLEKYHNELRQISSTNFKFRENGDPTDFCSSAAQLMHDKTPPAEILVSGSLCDDYDPVVAQAFLERLRPANCMIMVVDSDLNKDAPDEWKMEPLYGATYRESEISSERMEKWENPVEIDPKLHVPALNEYIPTDFSLRCDDDGAKMKESERKQSQKENPLLVHERANFRMWHKMDRFWRVPKTYIQVSLISPRAYESPRTMTLSRLFQRVLNDDLNSFVYDASLAGCNYKYVSFSKSRLSLSHTASKPSCIFLQQCQLWSYWL
jgi:insulysin